MANVSIITPFYHVPQNFLQKCVESLVRQTLHDIEFIFVDDGNEEGDEGLQYLLQKSAEDQRIKILRQNHCGVSQARNLGMEYASGEYIFFVDADDWIDSDTAENLYKMALLGNQQMVMFCGASERPENTVYHKLFGSSISLLDEKQFLFILESAINTNPDHGGIVVGILCKMYRTDFLRRNRLKFDKNLSLGEDRLFFLNALSFKPQIGYCVEACYHYRLNPDSLAHSYRDDFVNIVNLNYQAISTHSLNTIFPELKGDIQRWMYTDIARIILASLIQCYFHPSNPMTLKAKSKSLEGLISQPVCKQALSAFIRKSFNKKDKIKLFCCKHGFIQILFLLHWIQVKRNGN